VDGSDTAITANGLAHYAPTPGDRVLVLKVGGVVEIIQFLSRGTVPWSTSGVHTYRQAAEPGPSDTPPPSTGFLWFDSDDGDHQYRYDGTNWVSVQDATIATASSDAATAAANAATALSDATSAAADASAALTAAGTKSTTTVSTSPATGTPAADNDEWVQVDATTHEALGRWYGSGGAWVESKIGSDWIAVGAVIADTLEDSLELTTHIIAPEHRGTFDWVSDPVTALTVGSTATTGGTLDPDRYRYWVAAVHPTGLSPSKQVDVDLTGSGTSTNTQTISWTGAAGATDYRIWRRDLTVGGIDQTQLLGSAGTSFTDTGSGWVDGSKFLGTWSEARCDVNTDGITQIDGDGNLVTHLDNQGGVTFYQQTNFGVSLDDTGTIMAMRVFGPNPDDTTPRYESAIFFDLGPNTAAVTYTKNAADDTDWSLGFGGSTTPGADSMSLLFTSKSSGGGIPLIQLEVDGTSFSRVSLDGDGGVEIAGDSISVGDSSSTVDIPGTLTAPGIAPIGAMMVWPSTTLPSDGNWWWADGSSQLRTGTGFDALFAVIGTTFGFVDSTHFNLPDTRSRVVVGTGTHSLGATGGATTHTLTTAEMPAHTHGVGTIAAGSHTHAVGTLATDTTGSTHTHTVGYEYGSVTPGGGAGTRVNDIDNQTGVGGTNATATTTTTGSTHTHGITGATAAATPSMSGSTASAGSGTAFNIENPYIALPWIIRFR